jgi:hypothetical protein
MYKTKVDFDVDTGPVSVSLTAEEKQVIRYAIGSIDIFELNDKDPEMLDRAEALLNKIDQV